MQRFTALYNALDTTTRTTEKLAALEKYFVEAPAADAAWALYFLTGRKLQRAVSTRFLREWVSAESGVPLWLVEACYDAVGDLAEALALLLPEHASGTELSLSDVVEQRLIPLRTLQPGEQQSLLVATWREFDTPQRLLWHKLITGEFRVGVARTLVAKALAAVARVAPALMAHRLMGHWEPTEADYRRLLTGDAEGADPGQPYPFFLAHPLEDTLEDLGSIDDWQAEWKWDGIRAQLLRRERQVLVWSRGEELMTDRFPEVRDIGRMLPEGTVLDGEILAWRGDKPLIFGVLQRRIGRKKLTPKILSDAPVVFMAYDLLEFEGKDVRAWPLEQRRAQLELISGALKEQTDLKLSPVVRAESWDQLREQQSRARELLVEGLMLKRRCSAYGVGRPKGDWWKWKVDPYQMDAVLMYAQGGHGRRASLYTDYTFGVWHEGQLVPVAKAYSGLTDEEIREVDSFIRRNTLDRFGPVRVVKPELVFELAFEAIQASTRHKCGLAVRFPRMARWRKDKKPEDADSLENLRALLRSVEARAG